MSAATPEARLRVLGDAGTRGDGDYVLYWMIASRRLYWTHALDRAIAHAKELAKPLLVFEPLDVAYRWASDRHHAAILDGMREHRQTLSGHPVGYYPYVEPEPGAGEGLLDALAERACLVVTDDSPVFSVPEPVEAAARRLTCRLEAVDGCGLLPLASADRTFGTAHSFRRFLQDELPARFGEAPSRDPLADARALPPLPGGGPPAEIVERWPAASDELLHDRTALAALPIDHSVAPTDWTGGHGPARRRLERFLDEGLPRYADERNDPDSGASSRLSPWLRCGQISAWEVFAAVADREGWSPARISPRSDGRRSGWWGMSGTAETFVDELVTWRELGYVYCRREPDYARYETLPEWALKTLEEHASDPREHVYSLDEFAAAETHDELWNAAQRQLVEDGVIHNYLRMLWGKKILEWSAHPREALDTMIELNNRFALDGRDPNSYSGITWVMGRFDRGWPERPIFGKVRSMTSRSTRRKVKLDDYMERWGGGD